MSTRPAANGSMIVAILGVASAACALTLGTLMVGGCSDSATPATQDAGTDSAADAAPKLSCGAALQGALGSPLVKQGIDIDPDGPDSQIHSMAVLADDGFYVVYNRPKAGAQTFEVFMRKFSCAGVALTEPVHVSDSKDNEVDPTAAWNGKELLVMWAADTGKSPYNLVLRSRRFDAQGEALNAVTPMALSRKGAPLSGNIWLPTLTATKNGYVVVGAWGNDDAPSFQTFLQKLGSDGTAAGDGADVDLDKTASQSNPAAIETSTGAIVTVWSQELNEGNAPATAWIKDDAAARQILTTGGSPSIATAGTNVWIASGAELLKLGAAKVDLPKGSVLPAVAADDSGGGAVATYVGAATRLPLKVTRFDANGVLGASLDVASAAATYPQNLVAIGSGVYLIAYQEGSGTKIRARVRVADLR